MHDPKEVYGPCSEIHDNPDDNTADSAFIDQPQDLAASRLYML